MYLNKCHITSIFISALLLIGAAVLLIGDYPKKLVDNVVDDQLSLSLDSPELDDWLNPPPPIYMQYWLFNLTNPDGFKAGAKADLEQVGPFTYRLYQPRFNVAFYPNDTVSYQYNHTLVYQPNMSKYDDPYKVNITSLNVPLLLVDSLLKNFPLPNIVKSMILIALGEVDLLVTHSAGNILFGYYDPVLHLAHKFDESFPAEFGLFYGFNNSDDGVYLVNTGKTDIRKVNKMEKWNYNSSLNYWSTKYGNMINGTDGVFFHPKMSTDEAIYAYSTDICRSLPFQFEEKSSINGLAAYRYHTTAMAFANTSVNPDNAAFCVPPGNCMGGGVLNISVCKQNAPIVISSPHFYLGDESYINAVNGMHPNKAEHETYIDVEPTTGVVLSAQKRLQLNAQLEPSNISPQLYNVHKTTFPLLWLNESVFIDDGSANHLKKVFVLEKFVYSTPYILIGISALILICVAASLLYKRSHKPKPQPLLVDTDDSTDKD